VRNWHDLFASHTDYPATVEGDIFDLGRTFLEFLYGTRTFARMHTMKALVDKAETVMRATKVQDGKGGTAYLREPIIKMIADMIGVKNSLPSKVTLDTLNEKGLFQSHPPTVEGIAGDNGEGKQKVNTLKPDLAKERYDIVEKQGAGSDRGRGRIPKW